MANNYKKKASKKLSKDELEQMRNFLQQLNNASTQVGNLELQKHKILHSMDLIERDFSVFQNNLKEKYGDVSVNTQTGELKYNIVE
jgi:hypothetical protein|tara:strand:- start:854 stop:1111 length:258 start_codon:yes stop_codon:yes gene_type:complete